MDFTSFLSSLNKISIVAFIITLAVLFYEVYLLKKDKGKKVMPQVPAFDEHKVPVNTNVSVIETLNKPIKKNNSFLITLLTIFLVVFFLVFIFGISNPSLGLSTKQEKPKTEINYIYSKGILIFDTNWNHMIDSDISILQPEDKIIIGIDKINGFDIDMARIKVNEAEWNLEHTTLNFNKDNNVYYQEYQLASDGSNLKIDAQLHSKTNGWLGK